MVGYSQDGYFFQKLSLFFSTSSAVFEQFWSWVTCFNWYFLSIMSAGAGKTNFWTCHLMKTTWKPPLNTGDFEVFTHFFSFCTTFLCFWIKPKPSRTLVLYLFYVWKLFFPLFLFPSIIYKSIATLQQRHLWDTIVVFTHCTVTPMLCWSWFHHKYNHILVHCRHGLACDYNTPKYGCICNEISFNTA